MTRPLVLLVDDGGLSRTWPFVRSRLEARLADACKVRYVDVHREPLRPDALTAVEAIAWFGEDEDVPAEVVAAAPRLRAVGAVVDGTRPSSWPLLRERGIPLIDATRAWAPSVAECGLALVLCGLRRIPQHHRELADGGGTWHGPQFADDPRFVNGDLGTKQIGVVGLGAIGSRIARWCSELGSRVSAHDPYAPDERFAWAAAQPVELDALCAGAEVLVVAVPPTPSAVGMIDARRIDSIPAGALVVTVTRTAVLDSRALRRRVLAGELAWASDVFDTEPLPPDDPLRGLPNVVHLPHIAGRTRDSNLRVADLIADDLLAVLDGRPAVCALTDAAATVRGGKLV